uniref:Salivary mucin n=1 Tax=Ornithodoros parkeri TaxID=140564 RepID=A6N9R9_ORNPR|nr:salivary mucin [Ornithodoros parkeri]
MNTATVFLLFLPVAFAGWREDDANQVPRCDLPQNPCGMSGIGSRDRWFYAKGLGRCKESGDCEEYQIHGYSNSLSCNTAHRHVCSPTRPTTTATTTTTTTTPTTPAVVPECETPVTKQVNETTNQEEKKERRKKKKKKGNKEKPKKPTKVDE